MTATIESRPSTLSGRIQRQHPTARVIRVISLDVASDRDIAALVSEIADVNMVVMVVPAGADASAAAVIGKACSDRRVMTTTVVVNAAAASDEGLSATLAQARPWSLMVVVVDDRDYVDDIVRSFR